MDLYREEILDHYKNPRNFGDLPGADIKVREANASCGDIIELSLRLKVTDGKKNAKIEAIKFKGLGCAISMASASLLTETVKGKRLNQAAKLTPEDIYRLLGGPVSVGRVKCATLPLKALEQATKLYFQEK